MSGKKAAIDFIVRRLIAGESDLRKLKNEAARRFSSFHLPKNSEIAAAFPPSLLTKKLALLLKRKPVRTLSGVSPVAVMIRPLGSCRHKCIYCPFTGKAAKSYTGHEPAALRARQYRFDAAKQVGARLEQYKLGGHPAEKCEIIVMGGTFLEMKKEYKNGFVRSIYEALNGKKSPSLEAAKRSNEKAVHRAVGLTVETRPDVCGKKEIGEMLSFGATRVELGVQNPDDAVYKKINRGHGVREVVDATALLRDSGLKVLYHIMPGLPGSSPKKDIAMVTELFSDTRFRPDMLKIYPTLVMPGTGLYALFEKGEYKPYSAAQAAEVISEFYRVIPPYVRVMRIQRDIPTNLIAGGVEHSNLREYVEKRIREKGIRPLEIRYREAGFAKAEVAGAKDFTLHRVDYAAGNGKEVFLSFENKSRTAITGFLRLRAPYKPFRSELADSAIVRELHVYGEEARLAGPGKIQHKGIGSALLREAERIAKDEWGFENISVISGVGAREYFYKKGYSLNGPYVSKRL